MSLALFFDVDGVLTEEPINIQIARQLGVENKLNDIESDFREGKISNEEFNKKFIPLFNNAGFRLKYINENINEIRMRIGYEKLFQFDNIHLVSSGPSYYIDQLGEKFGITKDRILCSRYEFDKYGILKSCVKPVNYQTKAAYVNQLVQKYNISIGVGDSPALDGAFLSHCTIKILMDEFRIGYLCVKDIESLVQLIINLQQGTSISCNQFGNIQTKRQPNFCFVIMPFTEGWSDRVYQCIKKALRKHDKLIQIKRADDLYGQDVMLDIWQSICSAHTVIADVTNRNPNVFYELGLSHATNCNTILITQNSDDIPFDLKRFRHIIYKDSPNGFKELEFQIINTYCDRKQH